MKRIEDMSEEKLKAIRITPETHAKVKTLAKSEGRYFERFADELLTEAIKLYKAKKETTENQVSAGAAA
jgi:mRNA-degrading endonuclease RelE of RelBE toxin-antitoxin system